MLDVKRLSAIYDWPSFSIILTYATQWLSIILLAGAEMLAYRQKAHTCRNDQTLNTFNLWRIFQCAGQLDMRLTGRLGAARRVRMA